MARARSATGRLTAGLDSAVRTAVDPGGARSLLGTKLLAAGLALVCVAGGLDYVRRKDRIKEASTAYLRDAGQEGLADTVESVDRQVEEAKSEAVDAVEEQTGSAIWEQLTAFALLAGAGLFATGIYVKLTTKGVSRGKVLRDAGRVMAMPGLIGALALGALSWREGLGQDSGDYFGPEAQGREWGELLDELGDASVATWEALAPVLLTCAVLLLAGLVLTLAIRRRLKRLNRPPTLLRDSQRWVALWAGGLGLVFGTLVLYAELISGGSPPEVLEIEGSADLLAVIANLSLLGVGLGLAAAGKARLRREQGS